MKIYFHLCLDEFTNSYLVVNDNPKVMEALIIDPVVVSEELINQIEKGSYKLTGVLITHNRESLIRPLTTLKKIYSPYVYAADYEIAGSKSIVIHGDGHLKVAGLEVEYYSVPGHASDSMLFKIGDILFTGDVITSGIIGETSGSYFKRMLCDNIEKKIYSQTDGTVIMPGHGPPSTVAAERSFNLDTNEKKRLL